MRNRIILAQSTTLGQHFGGSATAAASDNPFVRQAGKVPSVTAIAAVIRSNPQRARELCRAAGENPDAWMPNNPL